MESCDSAQHIKAKSETTKIPDQNLGLFQISEFHTNRLPTPRKLDSYSEGYQARGHALGQPALKRCSYSHVAINPLK